MPFKAVEWVRSVRQKNYQETKHLTPEERARKTEAQAQKLRRWLKRRKKSAIKPKD